MIPGHDRLAPLSIAARACLVLVAVLATAGVADAQQAYSGVQARTPVEQIPAGGQMRNFVLVGQNPLLDPDFGLPRGMNGGIAAVRDCVYVGSNIGAQPPLIVDMADMSTPTVIGELPGWIQGRGNGIEAIEAVPDLNLLVDTVRVSFANMGWDPPAPDANVGLLIYDVSDCRQPRLVGSFAFPNTNLHYMTLWRDPKQPDRVLANVTFNSGVPEDGIDIRVVDLTGCPTSCNPTQRAEWGLRAQYNIPPNLEIGYDGGVYRPNTQTHDATWSLDGTRMYAGQTHFGLLILDTTPLGNNEPCNSSAPRSPEAQGYCITMLNANLDARVPPFGNGVATVHGVVKIPNRPYVSLQHEGHSCPYGGIDFAYVGTQEAFAAAGANGTGFFRGDLFPKLVGTFGLPENNVDRCPKPGATPPATSTPDQLGQDMLRTTKTIHNVLAFPHIQFATWYSGGLRAIDTTNINAPFEAGYYFNKPAPEIRWCGEQTAIIQSCASSVDTDASGRPLRYRQVLPPDVMARSYPIAMNGYIVYSDENMGLQVLRYTGPHVDEIPQSGLCISHNPSVTSPGYEPCPPYSTN